MTGETFAKWYAMRRNELGIKAYPRANRHCGARLPDVLDGLAVVATRILRGEHLLARVAGSPPRMDHRDGKPGQPLEAYLVGGASREACHIVRRQARGGRGDRVSTAAPPWAGLEAEELRAAVRRCWLRLETDEKHVLRAVHCGHALDPTMAPRTRRRRARDGRAKLIHCFLQHALSEYGLSMLSHTIGAVVCADDAQDDEGQP